MKRLALLIPLLLSSPLYAADMEMDVDAALSEVPVNIMPLVDDDDGITIKGAVVFNEAGMALRWHFVTTAGAYTVTSVTPTSAGDYDWTDQGDSGIYTIEIPASGGASINNDTEGYGWFTGVATDIAPWRGPTICFRASGINDKLIDSAYDTTRGLAGTALPGAAAEAAGGLYTRGSGAGQIAQDANGQINVNVEFINDDATSASGTVTFPAATLASTTNITAGTITTATSVTNRVTANVDQLNGVSQSLLDLKDFADDGYDPTVDRITEVSNTLNTESVDSVDAAAIVAASFGAGAIDATAIATDAIGAAEVAASALTKGTEIAGFNDVSTTDLTNALTIVSGTADSGSTTTLVDAALTQGDGYWDDATVEFTSGTLSGVQARVHSFTTADDTITFNKTLPAAVSTQTYRILRSGSTEANVVAANSATITTTGAVPADVTTWNGTAVATPATAGYPAVTIKDGTGTGEIDTASGAVIAGSLGNTAKADVNAEVLDVLNVDTFSEPTGTPTATPTIRTALHWLYMAFRNGKTVTGTEKTLLDDSGTEEIDWELSDDGSTYTETEAAVAD